MQLYEKITQGKRVRYIPYTPPDPRMFEIPQAQMVTLLTTLTMSMLMSVEDQLPQHSRTFREIKNVEEAITRLAKLNAKPLDERLVNVGVEAWNSAIFTMQARLTGVPASEQARLTGTPTAPTALTNPTETIQ